MTVLYILHQTILMGGGTKSFLVMLRGLMQYGVKPIVVMPDHEGVYSEINAMHIPTIVTIYRDSTYPWIHSIKDIFLFLPRIILHRILNYLAVRRILKSVSVFDIELVHTNVSVCSIGFRVSRKLNVPHVYHIREYADKDFGLYYIPTRRIYLRQLSAPMSYNICITQDIQNYFGQDKNSCSRVIYNGIQNQLSEPPQVVKEDFFLYAGRLVAAKGVMELLESYYDYSSRALNVFPLYIIGEQPDQSYYNKITDYIRDHYLESLVTLWGQRADIQKFMQKARAIIIPSLNEGFGRCMPEAMFNGCLAIGRNTGGTLEQLNNGLKLTGQEIALRFDTNQQLTQHLIDVSSQPVDYYRPTLERAFQVVNQLYSSESNVNNVYHFYKQIVV